MTAAGLPKLPQIPTRAGNPCVDHNCSACCHDIEMLLTEADVERITAAGHRDFHDVADDGYLQLRTRDGPPAAGSHAAPGATPRPCMFLDAAGACTIHAVRPEGCRLYPAVWDDALRGAELDSDYCPHTDGFLLPASTVDAVRRLAGRLQQERTARMGRGAGARQANTF